MPETDAARQDAEAKLKSPVVKAQVAVSLVAKANRHAKVSPVAKASQGVSLKTSVNQGAKASRRHLTKTMHVITIKV